MSIKVMDEVLSRMFLDKDFRDLLRSDPEQALAGYDLTPTERAAFQKLKKRGARKKRNQPDLRSVNSGHSFSLN